MQKTNNMKLIKLSTEQYQRSLKARMNHLWLYTKNDTTQRTHNNSIYLSRTVGEPFAVLVVEYDGIICDEDIEKVFGKGTFYDGALSPYDKENLNVDVYYVKGLVK
jgi:hypothetical protein